MSTININDVENIVCINKWYHRLGNNIIQVHNAILIGLYFNCNVTIPAHSFFNTKIIKINNNKSLNKVAKITHPNNFFDFDIIKF